MDQINKFNTGYIYDEIYKKHILFKGHPESPQRLTAIENRLRETGLSGELKYMTPQKDPMDFIRKIHSNEHISQIKSIPATGLVASKAVSGVLEALDSVCKREVKNAFCSIRPPGHHAQNSGHEEGFCFYNNIAVAVRYIQEKYHHEKILIIDWDYHHGNASESAFYDDASVLFFSTHDWYAYPGTGDPSRIGAGQGKGCNINVHLSPGSGDDVIKKVWDDKLIPVLDDFNPDFVLISAGFDSRKDDFLGCFTITDKGFFDLTKTALQIAGIYCDGRLLSILEGGYNPTGLAKAVASHIEALLGK
ncbi:MAG: histone deacetylase [Candidatus Aminicenantes bacterium]